MNVVPTSTLMTLLLDLKTAEFDGAKIRLFVNNINPSPGSILTDFTEATFGGYTAGGNTIPAWNTPYIGNDGSILMLAPLQQWNATGVGDPESVFGIYVVGDPGGTPYLLYAERFASQVDMAEVGDSLPYLPQFQLSGIG